MDELTKDGLNAVRKLCGKCHACGCDECFKTGNCRVCKQGRSDRYEEKRDPKTHAWVGV